MIKRTTNQKRAWKMERATIHHRNNKHPHSNKFSGGDTGKKPTAHTRKGVWVGGYKRRDGTPVKGYYRTNAQYLWRR